MVQSTKIKKPLGRPRKYAVGEEPKTYYVKKKPEDKLTKHNGRKKGDTNLRYLFVWSDGKKKEFHTLKEVSQYFEMGERFIRTWKDQGFTLTDYQKKKYRLFWEDTQDLIKNEVYNIRDYEMDMNEQAAEVNESRTEPPADGYTQYTDEEIEEWKKLHYA